MSLDWMRRRARVSLRETWPFLRALSKLLLSALAAFVLFLPIGVFAQDSPPRDEAMRFAPETVQTLLDIIGYLQTREDRSVYEPSALAERLPSLPEDIARFVRDNTAYRPYFGALKGAQGVLADRTANSLDRALLAEALLSANGLETRIGQTRLSSDQVEVMLRLAKRPIPFAGPTSELTAEDLAVFLNQGGLTPDDIRSVQAEFEEQQDKLGAVWTAEAESFLEEMAPLLSDKHLEQADMSFASKAAEQHFFLEFRQGEDPWQVLNLSEGIDEAIVPGTADAYFANADELPETLTRTVFAELILTFPQSAPQGQVSLGMVEVRADRAARTPLRIAFAPLADAGETPRKFSATETGLPSVMVAQLASGSTSISRTFGPDGGPPASPAQQGFESITNKLDSLFGEPAEEVAAVHAEGLLVRYRYKDQTAADNAGAIASTDRWIVDTTGQHPDAPLSSFMGTWQAKLDVIPYAVTPEHLQYEMTLAALEKVDRVLQALIGAATSDQLPPRDGGLGHRIAALAQSAIEARADCIDETGGCFYLTRPTIIAEEIAIRGLDTEVPNLWRSTDLLQVSGRTAYGSEGGVDLATTMLWTAAEHRALADDVAGAPSESPALGGFYAQFSQSGGNNVTLQVVDPATDDFLEFAGNLAPLADQRVEALVWEGSGRQPRLSIVIDRASGTAIGRTSGGRGAADTEQLVTLETAALVADRTATVVETLACLGTAFADTLSKVTAQPPQTVTAYDNARPYICLASGVLNWLGAESPHFLNKAIILQLLDCSQSNTGPAECLAVAGASALLRHGAFASQHSHSTMTRRVALRGSQLGSALRILYAARSVAKSAGWI